jgi:hypothetical protein
MDKETHSADASAGSPIAVQLEGPFSATTFLWRGRRGELQCSVIVKTTYLLRPGACPVADRPDPIWTADLYWESSPLRSVRVPSDLAPLKHAPEVTLVGHAYAPDSEPRDHLAVRLAVGDIDKALDVFPPRGFSLDGTLEVNTATRMPLGYERAAGGQDTENPVGVDTETIDELGRRYAPSVLHAGHSYERLDDIALPAGFGPIAAVWPARVQRLRREDFAWLAEPAVKPMPHGFDSRYFQVAPLDQWLTEPLRSDERIVLENLAPNRERLVTNLKAVVPHAAVVMWKTMPVSLTPDTLFIDTDRAIVTLTWRGSVEVGEGALPTRVLVTRAPAAATGSGPVTEDAASVTAKIPELGFGDGLERTQPTVIPKALMPRSVMPPASSASRTMPVPSGGDEVASVRAGLLPPPPSMRSAPPPSPVPAQPPLITMPAPAPSGPSSVAPGRAQTATLPPPPQDPSRAAPAKRNTKLPTDAAGLRAMLDAPEGGNPRPAAEGPVIARSMLEAPASVRSPRLDEARSAPETPVKRRALVDLLGFDPALPARLRRTPAFTSSRILDAAADRAAPARVDDARSREDRDRTDVLRVLSFAEPLDLQRARALVAEAFADPNQLDLPIAVIAGALAPAHDDFEVLRATLAVASPLASASKDLKAALKRVEEALASGYAPAAETVSTLLREVEEAAGTMGGHVRGSVQRIAVDGRRYKLRTVLGEARIRAELTTRGGESLPVYIPEAVAAKLPMLPSFPVVLVAELRPREDAQEAHPEALIALAVGRVLRPL